MQLSTIGNEITMTSLELVQFINNQRAVGEAELQHKHFLEKVPKVLGEGYAIFSATYVHQQNGQTYPCYKFPKREACLMAMSYSYDLQAKVFDRMTELEQQQTPKLPKTFSEALRLAAEQAEQIETQALQLEQQRPAVEFVERYVEARSSKAISDVAKILGAKPQAFFTWLHESGIIFKRNGSWMPYSGVEHHFEVKTGEANGHAFTQSKFTPHGIAWISEKWNKSQSVSNA
jgi:phage antirepressor YoqD-like protein